MFSNRQIVILNGVFFSNNKDYPVLEFEKAKIFNGKSFWEAEKDIEWVDC